MEKFWAFFIAVTFSEYKKLYYENLNSFTRPYTILQTNLYTNLYSEYL